jgi:magnesium-transporting ATPase (P-type)
MVRSNLIRLRKLALTQIEFTVLRDSRKTLVAPDSVVPGDILLLENGMKIPCDCILL